MLDSCTLDRLRREYDIIPVVRELSADTLTPVAAFAAIQTLSEEAFLFESVERGENVGRYSFAGIAPRRRIAFPRQAADPIATLRRELVPLRVYGSDGLPPFHGGAVAFFGYGAARWSEKLPDANAGLETIPDAVILFFDTVVVFDHVRQRLLVIANLFANDPQTSEELIERAADRIDEMVALLACARPQLAPLSVPAELPPFRANMSRTAFTDAVKRAKEEIAAGEAYQIVLSQRWDTPYRSDDALTLYRALRSINPSPYMFLLRMRECTLVGASPEMLVRVENRRAELRPIAGTRPRGKSRDEDFALEAELLGDAKENAEHLMLVDLGRNDLGRVCASGSVAVTEFARVERYSHVMHLVSSVEGVLRDDASPIDLFLSAFPAGTVTGAPKIRAMELIDEIEPSRRGPYAGAVAYVGFSGNLDSCITIRTILLHGGRAYVQAGAGIVADSEPEREFEEAVNKSAALRNALAAAGAALDSRLAQSHRATAGPARTSMAKEVL